MSAEGIISVNEFKKAVEVFGFGNPVVTAIWNTMESNPANSEEFETVYAMWTTGKFYKDTGDKMRRWFAVLSDADDTDWGTGSHGLAIAKQMLVDAGYEDGRIAVINIENDPFCERIITREELGI